MNIGTKSIFFLVVVLGIASCSRMPEGSQYFAALQSERQTYSIKMSMPAVGNVEGTAIIRQEGTVEIGGKTYYKSVTTFDGIPGATPETNFYRIADDGIFSRKSTDPNAPELVEIPFPAEVGRKSTSLLNGASIDVEIAAIETLDTAEKSFPNCLKVIGKGSRPEVSMQTISYYAPKIGLVKKSSMIGSEVAVEMTLRR